MYSTTYSYTISLKQISGGTILNNHKISHKSHKSHYIQYNNFHNRESRSGSPLRSILDSGRVIKYPDIRSQLDALLNSKNGKTVSFMNAIDVLGNDSFQLLPLRDAIVYDSSFSFQKDSEFTKLFNFHIAKMHESGVSDLMVKKYLKGKTDFGVDNEVAALGFENVLFPFLMLSIGGILALKFCVLEKILRKFRV